MLKKSLTICVLIAISLNYLYSYNFKSSESGKTTSINILLQNLKTDDNYTILARINNILTYSRSSADLKNVYFIKGIIEKRLKLEAKYTKSFKRAAEYGDYLSDYALFELAKYYTKKKKNNIAANYYYQILEHYPDSVLRRKALLNAVECYSKRESYYNIIKILNCYPDFKDDAEIVFIKAQLYYKKGDYRESYKYLKKAFKTNNINLKGSVARYLNKIIYKLSENMSQEEKQSLLLDIAKTYYEACDYYGSIGVLRKLSYSPEKFYWMGKNEQRLGRLERATSYYKTIIKRYKTSDLLDEAIYHRAACNMQLGYTDFAAESYKNFVKEYPYSDLADNAYLDLAEYYYQENNLEKCLTYLEKIRLLYPNNETYNKSLWKESIINFKKKNYEKSIRLLELLRDNLEEGKEKAKVLFWLGKISSMVRDYEKSVENYGRMVQKYPREYYTYRAVSGLKNIYALINKALKKQDDFRINLYRSGLEKIANRIKNLLTQRKEFDFSYVFNKQFSEFDYRDVKFEVFSKRIYKEHFYKYYILSSLKEYEYALDELEFIINDKKDDKKYAYNQAVLYTYMKKPDEAIRIVDNLLNKYPGDFLLSSMPRKLKSMLCPKFHEHFINRNAYKNKIDPSLVLAVIREESRFNNQAVSRSGAIGLMQIMPGTGKWISRQINSKHFRKYKLFFPSTNIKFGSWYLAYLIEKFNGTLQLALAAYNGGWRNVEKWLNKYKPSDIDEFVENIPFRETKNYVKKVLRSYNMYKLIYDNGYEVERLTTISSSTLSDFYD